MNRRIVIINETEFPNYLLLYNLGIREVYTISLLESKSEAERLNILKIIITSVLDLRTIMIALT